MFLALWVQAAPDLLVYGGTPQGVAAVVRKRGVDFPSLLAPEALSEVRLRLGKQGARLFAEGGASKEELDRKDPGFAQAVDLLRRGLFNAPYNLRGELGLSRPILVGDFLASLVHFYRAKGDREALTVVLTARELYRWGSTDGEATGEVSDPGGGGPGASHDFWAFLHSSQSSTLKIEPPVCPGRKLRVVGDQD